MRQEILIGVERRRRWSAEQKLRILAEVGVNGAGVSDVARRHDISRQHLYQWRHELRRKGLGGDDSAVLLPAGVVGHEASPPESIGGGEQLVEIRLGNGRSLCIGSTVPDRQLQRLIRAVEGA